MIPAGASIGVHPQIREAGDLLVRLGYVTPVECKLITDLAPRPGGSGAAPRLGGILVSAGHILADQLAEALDRMRTTGRRLGEELTVAGNVTEQCVAYALRLQRWVLAVALIAALMPAASTFVEIADAAQAQMAVTATVVDTASMRMQHQAQKLDITAQDVQRGYVEVHAGSSFEIGSKAGYILDFQPVGDVFRSVTLTGIDGTFAFGPGGGVVVQSRSVGGAVTVTLGYRFELAQGVAPGSYSWPLLLSVLPL